VVKGLNAVQVQFGRRTGRQRKFKVTGSIPANLFLRSHRSSQPFFAMSIRAIISITGFTINVYRVDALTGWSQQLRVNWQAWQ
jgi:hypothetical protein